MNPALRERVLRSLGARSPSTRLPPRAIAVLRFVSVALLLVSVGLLISFQRRETERLEHAKQELRETLRRHALGLTPDDWQTLPRAEKWLRSVSADYPGDLVPAELGDETKLARLLGRRAIYARGPLSGLTESHDLGKFVARGQKDAFLDCLLDPPDSLTEKELLARLAHPSGGYSKLQNVEPLGAALAGMPLLAPAWSERFDSIDSVEMLAPLRELVQRAPLAEARRAARAELLLLVLDEDKAKGVPVEIDGTARHAVRFAVFDLRADRQVARLRRTLDPEWISNKQRQRRARDLSDCHLAAEMRQAFTCQPPCAPKPAASSIAREGDGK